MTQRLTHVELTGGVKFESAFHDEVDAKYPKRHAGCISGCSQGTDHRFHHHPYCHGPTWGNWQARYHNLVTDLNIAVDELIELVIFEAKFDDVDRTKLGKLVALVKESKEALDQHLRERPTKYGPLL